MTAPELAVSPQVGTALLSGGVALVVALLGIAGAIAAQLVATRRAFGNSLALLERQHAVQEQQRQEQVRREDAYRFADQRRTTYARFLRLAAELAEAREYADDADDSYESIGEYMDVPGLLPDRERDPAVLADRKERALEELQNRLSRWQELESTVLAGVDEIHLLASANVRQAASALLREAGWPPRRLPRAPRHPEIPQPAEPDEGSDRFRYHEAARTAFVEAARYELGVGETLGRNS